MIKLGIFAKTFTRNSLEGVLDAVSNHGFSTIQFNMTCAGLPPMPDIIPQTLTHKTRKLCTQKNIKIAAISGTFNMIHPDAKVVQTGLQRLEVLASQCRALGTNTITLCTGTRDAHDKWRAHPGNNFPEAWSDLLSNLEKALEIAEQHDIQLAFEPETANVVNSTVKGKQLLREMQSDRLKVVFDPANLFETAPIATIKKLILQGLDDLKRRHHYGSRQRPDIGW